MISNCETPSLCPPKVELKGCDKCGGALIEAEENDMKCLFCGKIIYR